MEDLREIREARSVLARLKAGQVTVLDDELCLTATQTLDLMQAKYQSPLLQLLITQTRNLHLRLGQLGLTVLSLVLSWLCTPDSRHFLCKIEAAERCFSAAIACLKAAIEPIDVCNLSLLRQILASSEEIRIPGSRFPTLSNTVLQAYLSSIPSQSGDFTCASTRLSIQTVDCPGLQSITVIQGVLVPFAGSVTERKAAIACVYESVWLN